jgi:hypothetical protein
LYCNIEICWLRFIKVRVFGFEFQIVKALALLPPSWTIGVPCRVVFSAVGTLMCVALAFSGGMIVSAASLSLGSGLLYAHTSGTCSIV